MPIITNKRGQPLLSGDEADRTVRLSLSMPESLRAELARAVERDKRSTGAWVRQAIVDRLTREAELQCPVVASRKHLEFPRKRV